MVTNHSHIALQQIFKSKRDYISYANDISYWIFLSSLTQSHFCNLQILISFLNNISSIIDNYAYSFSKLYFPPFSVLIDLKLLSKIVILPEVTDVTSFSCLVSVRIMLIIILILMQKFCSSQIMWCIAFIERILSE